MTNRKVPKRLWDFALVWIVQVYSRTATRQGHTGYEVITGDTPDISKWVDFTFYDWVWYLHAPDSDENPRLGRWLGMLQRVGSALCYWILPSSGRVIALTTVQHVTSDDLATEEVRMRMTEYNDEIQNVIGNDTVVPDNEASIIS
jgi:hypothetical protein